MAVTQLLRGGVHLRRPTLTLVLVVAYAGLAAASLSWSSSVSGTLDALASLGISLAYMAAVLLVLKDSRDLLPIFWAVALWSALLGGWWILSYARGDSREFNALGDPNFFAALQVVAAPLVLALIGATRRRAARIVLYVALVLIAGSIPASLSRGGMVALILTGVVIAIIMMARLSAYSRSISVCRVLASTVRRFARFESSAAISALIKNANSATQFSGSEIDQAPTGGRKK